MSIHEEYAGYLFVYFTDDEGQGGGEEIYFALSKGNDPLHWRELNGGKPVLTSQLGEKACEIRSSSGRPKETSSSCWGRISRRTEDGGNWLAP